MAGTDTTATAVRCIMYFIITNHRVYSTLQSELDNANFRRPVICDTEARQLPYLQACIQEGLRIWPPVTGLQVKLSPPAGDTYNGRFIPGGTNIGYSAWALHHSKEIYGADADIFRPERWIEAQGERLATMTRSAELVFGTGKNGCLGKTIAFLELNKIFAEVPSICSILVYMLMLIIAVQMFLRFDFTVVNPQRGFTTKCNGFFVQKDMNVIVMPRRGQGA